MPRRSRSTRPGVSVAQFRRLCLRMPQAVEGAHMNTADFRVGGRIFATLFRQHDGLAMVKLQPLQQQELIVRQPGAFAPIKGGWGRMGATEVRLSAVDKQTLTGAIQAAWRNAAPARLVESMIFQSTLRKDVGTPAVPVRKRRRGGATVKNGRASRRRCRIQVME